MKNALLTILGFLALAPVAYGAFGDPFISTQLAPSPSNGDCLTTDGTDNIWDTCAGGASAFDFPSVLSWGNATSTTLGFFNGFLSTASSTFTGGFLANRSTTTSATSTNFAVSSLTSALVQTNANGTMEEYAGTSCTNQFVRALSALGVATCATIGASDVSLAELTAGTGLTSAGTYTGATARTFSVDQSFAPTWTGAHIFNNITRSTTTEATTTNIFSTTGNFTTLCISLDCKTAWPSAGGGNSKFATSSADTLAIHPSDALRVGIGTTTPKWALQVSSSTGPQLTLSDPSTLTNNHWSVRNAGGNLYLGTSSPSTFATGTAPMLSFSNSTRQIGIGTSTFDGSGYGITIDLPNPSIVLNSGANFVDRNANEAGTSGLTFDGFSQVTGRNAAADVTSISWTTRKLTNGLAYQLNTRTAVGGTLNTLNLQNLTGTVGIATTTPRWALQIATSTGAQLTLSDSSVLTNNHWSFRNAGGNFFLATSSPSTFATSSASVLSINANGRLTLANDLLVTGNATSTNATSTNLYISGRSITIGANNTHITGTTTKSFNVSSTTMGVSGLGTGFKNGTTTLWLETLAEGMIVRGVYCVASSTGTALLRFGDQSGNYTNTITPSTGSTRTLQALTTNNTWTAGEDLTIQASSTAGTVQRIGCTLLINTTTP